MLNYTFLCLLCIHLLQCISLCFVCCKGIKNIKRQKMENPCQIPEYCKNLEKPKKQKIKKGEPMYIQNLEKPKKKNQKGQNLYKTKKNKKTKMAEPMSQCLAWGQYFCFFCFFWFFEVKQKKQKKPKWQNLCPSVWHGVNTFVFFGFSR